MKGATLAGVNVVANGYVSIHAPVKGATSSPRVGAAGLQGFNPRPREGGDPERPVEALHGARVSIHAPVKGATETKTVADKVASFQSTPP